MHSFKFNHHFFDGDGDVVAISCDMPSVLARAVEWRGVQGGDYHSRLGIDVTTMYCNWLQPEDLEM